MKITRIRAYRVELPLQEGSYKWSGGKSVSVFDSTIVAVDTDAGLTGYGEVCPLGPFYLPAYAAGARAGIAELGPHLLGEDPRQIGQLNRRMDAALQGHAYVKSAIDMACWDILGKATGSRSACCWAAAMATTSCSIAPSRRRRPRRWRAGSPATGPRAIAGSSSRSAAIRSIDIERIRAVAAELAAAATALVADANTGWLMHDALRVVRAVRDIDVYIEQPCRSYEECLTVRRHCDHPFVLDEVIDSLDPLLRGPRRSGDGRGEHQDQQVRRTDAGPAQARDLCVSLGIAMTIEDSWGGDIVTAAIAHLAHSTPPEFLFTSTDFNSYVTVSTAEGAPQRAGRPDGGIACARAWASSRDGRAGRADLVVIE